MVGKTGKVGFAENFNLVFFGKSNKGFCTPFNAGEVVLRNKIFTADLNRHDKGIFDWVWKLLNPKHTVVANVIRYISSPQGQAAIAQNCRNAEDLETFQERLVKFTGKLGVQSSAEITASMSAVRTTLGAQLTANQIAKKETLFLIMNLQNKAKNAADVIDRVEITDSGYSEKVDLLNGRLQTISEEIRDRKEAIEVEKRMVATNKAEIANTIGLLREFSQTLESKLPSTAAAKSIQRASAAELERGEGDVKLASVKYEMSQAVLQLHEKNDTYHGLVEKFKLAFSNGNYAQAKDHLDQLLKVREELNALLKGLDAIRGKIEDQKKLSDLVSAGFDPSVSSLGLKNPGIELETRLSDLDLKVRADQTRDDRLIIQITQEMQELSRMLPIINADVKKIRDDVLDMTVSESHSPQAVAYQEFVKAYSLLAAHRGIVAKDRAEGIFKILQGELFFLEGLEYKTQLMRNIEASLA